MQIIKLKRIGSNIPEEVNLQRFYAALERANSIDDILRIGDVNYILSSLDVDVPAPQGATLLAPVPVSNNEAMHLFTTSKLMIPAPGAGKFVKVLDIAGKNLVGSIPFSGLAPKLRYVGVLSNDIAQFDNTFLNATQPILRSAIMTSAKNYIENAGVELYIPGFDLTAGNGSMFIAITYSIQNY